MALLSVGVLRLTFEDNPLDTLPPGNPHTVATENLLNGFPGTPYASPVFFSTNPDKWAVANEQLPNRLPFSDGADPGPLNALLEQASGGQTEGFADGYPGPHNITDEVYVRAIQEFEDFIHDRIPEVTWGITLASQVRLVNFTNTGVPLLAEPDPAAFTMPGTGPEGSAQYNAAWQTWFAAAPDAVKSINSADWTTTRAIFLFEPDGASLNEIGVKVYDAVAEYTQAIRSCDEAPGTCTLKWNVFDPDLVIVDPRGPAAASSYLTQTTLHDVAVLGPLAAGVIGIMLFAAFRRPGPVFAMVLPLSMAGLGVLGIFGWIRLPIHSISLLVFPVLMGNGIDFGIHMGSAYHAARQRGASVLDAAAAAGEESGMPLAVATLTTLAGMVLLVLAPNRMLSQLGLAIILGMVILLAISLTALPAALTWTTAPKPGREVLGRALESSAAFWQRNRIFGAVIVVAFAGSGLVAATQLDTLTLGTPAAFFPPGDPQRQDFDASNQRYFVDQDDLVTNALVIEGDMTTPAAMELLHRLEDAMRELDFIRQESVTSIRFAMEGWILVREGTAGAPIVLTREAAQPGSTFPTTQEDIRATLDEMFANPLATYASFFIEHPSYDIGTLLIEWRQAPDFEGLEAQWNQVLAAIEATQAEVPNHGLSIHIAGQTSVAYLFTKEELPYVQVAGVIGVLVTGLIVWAIRRNIRDAATVASVVATASLGWLGLLYLLNIQLSIALIVPAVVLAAIGSDYALHLRYALARDGNRAWRTVGRAVVYSMLTDAVAFLVFAQLRYSIVAEAAIATVAALAATLAATLVVVPILHNPHPQGAPTLPGSQARPDAEPDPRATRPAV